MLKLWEVRFQLVSGAIFKSFVPAYSNGGAENLELVGQGQRASHYHAQQGKK